jgi:hypothetical protein
VAQDRDVRERGSYEDGNELLGPINDMELRERATDSDPWRSLLCVLKYTNMATVRQYMFRHNAVLCQPGLKDSGCIPADLSIDPRCLDIQL